MLHLVGCVYYLHFTSPVSNIWSWCESSIKRQYRIWFRDNTVQIRGGCVLETAIWQSQESVDKKGQMQPSKTRSYIFVPINNSPLNSHYGTRPNLWFSHLTPATLKKILGLYRTYFCSICLQNVCGPPNALVRKHNHRWTFSSVSLCNCSLPLTWAISKKPELFVCPAVLPSLLAVCGLRVFLYVYKLTTSSM